MTNLTWVTFLFFGQGKTDTLIVSPFKTANNRVVIDQRRKTRYYYHTREEVKDAGR